MADHKFDNDSDVVIVKAPRTNTPKLFKVLLHNDDYTSMDFVIEILETIFHKSPTDAAVLTMTIHRTGMGVAGIFSRDIAETKVQQVESLAVEFGYPLLCTMEPE